METDTSSSGRTPLLTATMTNCENHVAVFFFVLGLFLALSEVGNIGGRGGSLFAEERQSLRRGGVSGRGLEVAAAGCPTGQT